MSDAIAFVGDVEGNVDALRGLWAALDERGSPHAVFLGDYINKGERSAEVMERVVEYWRLGRATLLRGNHETAFLHAMESGVLGPFLKMGGAMTIRSYVGRDVGPDVWDELRCSVPGDHLDAIQCMPEVYESRDVIAQHIPPSIWTPKYRVSAHVPVGPLPRIGRHSAQLDTGCGTDSGRLTALLWPSLDYVQVDARGIVVG